MADTTNYGFHKPDVGGSNGAWGTMLNTALDAVDATIKAVSDVATAALPKAGGTVTGHVQLQTESVARQDIGSMGGSCALDVSSYNAFTGIVDGAVTLTVGTPAAGTVVSGFLLKMQNPGSAPITWPASFRWPGGAPPAFSVSGIDVVAAVTFDGGVSWLATLVMKDVG